MSSNKYIKSLLLILLLFCFIGSYSQYNLLSLVLSKKQVGKEFLFDSSSKENGFNKTFIRYLGDVKCTSGKSLKFLNYSHVWGKNRHTTGVLFVYGADNKFLGKYHLGSSSDLPKRIEGIYLLFTNQSKISCNRNLITKIDFSNGLRDEIFLKCKGSSGDVYSLSKGE